MGCGGSKNAEGKRPPSRNKTKGRVSKLANVSNWEASGSIRFGPPSFSLHRTSSYHEALGSAPQYDPLGNPVGFIEVYPFVPPPKDSRVVFVVGWALVDRVAADVGMTAVHVVDLIGAETSAKTPWGEHAAVHAAAGRPLPSRAVAWLLTDHLASHPNGRGFIVTGHPANATDAAYLDALGFEFELVVALEGGGGGVGAGATAGSSGLGSTTAVGVAGGASAVFGGVRVDRLETVDATLPDDAVYDRLTQLATALGATSSSTGARSVPEMLKLVPVPHRVRSPGAAGRQLAGAVRELEKNVSRVVAALGQLEGRPGLTPSSAAAGRALAAGGATGRTAESAMATPWEGPASIGDCVDYLFTREKAMEEGLFRVPGMKTTVDAYHDAYAAGRAVDLSKELDPAAIAGLLKREISHHAFPLDAASASALALAAESGGDDDEARAAAIARALRSLEPARAAGLRKLAALLAKVVAHKDKTKMSAEALAIAVGPTIFAGIPRKKYPALLDQLLSDRVWDAAAGGSEVVWL